MLNRPLIALVGKVGHGKTMLLNKLTEARFPSHMGARSCTRTLQFGYTSNHGILVVDTPGFYASDDVAAHIAAQKLALEGELLSGIFVVLKYARADELAETTSHIMNFIGDDNLRLIITHGDIACTQPGFDLKDMIQNMASLLAIPYHHITVVGKDTNPASLEKFINSTLHPPKEYKISQEQVASISSLCMGARKFNKLIDEVHAKLAAASKACEKLVQFGKSAEADIAITTVQGQTSEMVRMSKETIFQNAYASELTEEQSNLVYGKAGLALAIRLKSFIEATNVFLSWDITDPIDTRNIYRKCPNCGAVFNKTMGCDGETVCGLIPHSVKTPRPNHTTRFYACGSAWHIHHLWFGEVISVSELLQNLCQLPKLETEHQPANDCDEHSTFESGCGATITWSSMLPVEPEVLEVLGHVELQHADILEQTSKENFEKRIEQYESLNRKILKKACHSQR